MFGMEIFDLARTSLMAMFSCLKRTDWVSAVAIISRRLMTSCSKCLT